ncbi:uncharacterized protein LOC110033985 isoform X2 [Phalaenopsis equestris]|uniref:uncharacterized protein LOC110033985 isoform X2 n=1 Tax=Phalaenopsis equestris TaxID=78828 RepID=UPI0009E21583|nr:uncharacterized protein LOC110033985 isoform X2 [Phalaenopsis equestris]
MAEEEVDGKGQPSPSQLPFLEVLCKSCGKVRRFASGTEAGFAVCLINSKLSFEAPPALYIEAAKDGEESICFGPKAALFNYGEGWKLQTVIEEAMKEGYEAAASQKIPKQISSMMKPSESRYYIGKPAAGTDPTTGFQYFVKILIAFALMFVLGGALVVFLENLPWLIQLVSSF